MKFCLEYLIFFEINFQNKLINRNYLNKIYLKLYIHLLHQILFHKKVPLRDRKRRTVRGVLSLPVSVRWGYLYPVWGVPLSCPEWYPVPGYPFLPRGPPPFLEGIRDWGTPLPPEGNGQTLGYLPRPQKGPGTRYWGTPQWTYRHL